MICHSEVEPLQVDLTPNLQIYRDGRTKLIRYWKDASRKGRHFDWLLEKRIPEYITSKLSPEKLALLQNLMQ